MSSASEIEQLATLFLPSVRLVVLPHEADAAGRELVVVEVLRAGEPEPASLKHGATAVLVVPDGTPTRTVPPTPAPVLVAVERHDTSMARRVTELFNPARVSLELLHVAWLPAIVPSPSGGHGLDNPAPSELVAYDGAREALLDCADQLREGGFRVATHLREDRETIDALTAAARRFQPSLVVLGRGRHGVGLGRTLLREHELSVLYVAARAR